MKRILASLLLALISFPLISPALFADAESHPPACCRREGKHHCDMKPQEEPAGQAFNASAPKCPLFGKFADSLPSSKVFCLSSSPSTGVVMPSVPTSPLPSQSVARAAFRLSLHKRGPPSPSIA